MQTPFVLLQAIPLAGLTRGEGSGRTAFRGRRQNIAEIGFRLSSCISLGARGSRISVLFPSRARLRGSRRGCLDVLTRCHWGLVAVRRPSGAFATGGGRRHRNMQGSPPRAIFLPFPESLKDMAVPIGFLLPPNIFTRQLCPTILFHSVLPNKPQTAFLPTTSSIHI